MLNWICSCEFGTFPFHTVVITKIERLDCDNCNLYSTETKAMVGIYLYLLTVVIPNAPNHTTVSHHHGSELGGGSTRYSWTLLGPTEYTSVIHNYSISQGWLLFVLSQGMWYCGLDFDLALESQVYIVWKFHIVRRLGRIMLSFNRLRELSSLLALVLHLAIGISHFIRGESKADHFKWKTSWLVTSNLVQMCRFYILLKWKPSKWTE